MLAYPNETPYCFFPFGDDVCFFPAACFWGKKGVTTVVKQLRKDEGWGMGFLCFLANCCWCFC